MAALEQKAFALELKVAGSQPHPRKRQLDALDAQLEDVYTSLQPTPQDYQARIAAVNFVNLLARDKLSVGEVKKELGVCHAQAFGSFTMDMFTPTSDLDISLNTECETETPSRDWKVKLLRKLTKVLYSLQANGSVRHIQPVLKAKVPVVKFIHCNTGLECDVSVENWEGIIKSELLHIFSSIDGRFRKLCFLLKAWANAHRINSSKDNTLNSLSIILLAAFHLQTRVPAILPPFSVILKGLEFAMKSPALSVIESRVIMYKDYGKKNKESTAQLFNSFLTQVLAVKDLWVEGLCASAYEGRWKLIMQPSSIFVEDFTSLSQNAARSVNSGGFDAIYKCCNETLLKLKGYLSGSHKAQPLKSLFTPLPKEPGVLPAKRKRLPFQDTRVDVGEDHPLWFHHSGYVKENPPVSWGGVRQSSGKRPRNMMGGMDYLARSTMCVTGTYYPPLNAQILDLNQGLVGEHSAKWQSTFVDRAFPVQNNPQPQPLNVGVCLKDKLPSHNSTHVEVSQWHADVRRDVHWLAESKPYSAHPGVARGVMPPTLTNYPYQLYTETAIAPTLPNYRHQLYNASENVLYQNMYMSHLPVNGYGFRAT